MRIAKSWRTKKSTTMKYEKVDTRVRKKKISKEVTSQTVHRS